MSGAKCCCTLSLYLRDIGREAFDICMQLASRRSTYSLFTRYERCILMKLPLSKIDTHCEMDVFVR